MCAICRRYLCPSVCPSFMGESAELGKRLFKCAVCNEWIYEDDEFVINYGKPYCKTCEEIGAGVENEQIEREGAVNGDEL